MLPKEPTKHKSHRSGSPWAEYPGDFHSRFVTLKKSKHFSGGNYELIGGERVADRWTHLVKSHTGQSDWFEHAVVTAALEGYWNKPVQVDTVPTGTMSVITHTHQVEADESEYQHTLNV